MIGKRLKEARKTAGLTQEELAERVNLDSSASISHYENDIHSPSYSIICQIAEELDMPECWFYCRNEALAISIMESYRENKEFQLIPEEVILLQEVMNDIKNIQKTIDIMLNTKDKLNIKDKK
ncbi:hypothetical protein KCQ_05436 [Pectobacterium atrosepticum ICMP 1526]|uniref:helix-turn-helix domain-containing protein n=1 Tax=Pectobacterium atrosepticum TaxID=29471 RepID=UPI00065D5598|nr:helix-turn-helix domain-containing protein [Pectobacterium atrosepticum]KMK87226.1 hypothetical protein KCQ_05436 [Pectobacterium atrosepticum ICMP 1526]